MQSAALLCACGGVLTFTAVVVALSRIQEMQLLDAKGVQIVDTTCPWVSKVWTAVEKHR
jgi:4-hydroxy-3-methylbut-2-enyl diphosphate reductase IspH